MKSIKFRKRVAVLTILVSVLVLSLVIETIHLFDVKDASKNTEITINDNENKNYSYTHNEDVFKINLANKQLPKSSNNPVILFGSDYQGDDRYESTHKIFNRVREFIKPDLFVMCGDYQVDTADKFRNSEDGIIELSKIFNTYFDSNIPSLYVQGNHDSLEAYGMAQEGVYESDKYIIYVINRDSFPNNQTEYPDQKDKVIETSNKLKNDLQSLIDRNIKKPILIASHVPLHYTNRNDGYDNAYASYLIDVLNEYGTKLDLVYLFGHNHSGNFDDYIGGSINHLAVGSEMKIGGLNKSTNINFTYLNAGYIGYANNLITDKSVKETSATSITVNNDYLSIQKYTQYGIYYQNPLIVKLKNK